jgi:hypothetical protein
MEGNQVRPDQHQVKFESVAWLETCFVGSAAPKTQRDAECLDFSRVGQHRKAATAQKTALYGQEVVSGQVLASLH